MEKNKCQRCGFVSEMNICPECGWKKNENDMGSQIEDGEIYQACLYGPPSMFSDKPSPAMYGPPPFYKRKLSCMAILLLLGALIGGIIAWFMPTSQQDCVYGPPPIEEQDCVYGPPSIEEPEPQPDLYGPLPVEEQEQLK